LFKSISRKCKNKEILLIQAHSLLNHYAIVKKNKNPLEVLFNLGRFYQFIGHDREAYANYQELMHSLDDSEILGEKNRKDLNRTVIYNYSMLLKKSGNDLAAHELIMNNLII
jgi:hypothetical protein